MLPEVDDVDAHLLDHYAGRTGAGYHTLWLDGKQVLLHRVITQAKPEDIVDHIDMNPSNNRRSNLRLVTKSVNSINRSREWRGVRWHGDANRVKRWQATLGRKSYGYYLTREEAREARLRAEAEVFACYPKMA